MNERITLISTFDRKDLYKIEKYTKKLGKKLCKVPYFDTISNRMKADTLPYHITLSTWKITSKDNVLNKLAKIDYSKLKILINDVKIMNGKEDSYILYFSIEKNKELISLHKKIYQMLPSEKYNPENFDFHISIHIDKDYDKLNLMKNKLLEGFVPFDLEIASFKLYEIYPAKFVKQFCSTINDEDYDEISPTAIVTSYPRTFTDIPYEKEIYSRLESFYNEKVNLNRMLAPEIEARYKLINKLLDKYKIKQVLELAAGFSSRGLIYSKKGYSYVELDLENISRKKKEILNSIEKNIPKNFNIVSGNTLRKEDFDELEKYFKIGEQITVIN